MVTAAVPDLGAVAQAWVSATDYEVLERHRVSRELDSLWGPAAASHPAAVVTRAPGSYRGFVRFVDAGVAGRDRPIYQTRGPMAIEFFARDASEVHERLAGGSVFRPIT